MKITVTRRAQFLGLSTAIHFVGLLACWCAVRGYPIGGVIFLVIALVLNEKRERAFQLELWGR